MFVPPDEVPISTTYDVAPVTEFQPIDSVLEDVIIRSPLGAAGDEHVANDASFDAPLVPHELFALMRE